MTLLGGGGALLNSLKPPIKKRNTKGKITFWIVGAWNNNQVWRHWHPQQSLNSTIWNEIRQSVFEGKLTILMFMLITSYSKLARNEKRNGEKLTSFMFYFFKIHQRHWIYSIARINSFSLEIVEYIINLDTMWYYPGEHHTSGIETHVIQLESMTLLKIAQGNLVKWPHIGSPLAIL